MKLFILQTCEKQAAFKVFTEIVSDRMVDPCPILCVPCFHVTSFLSCICHLFDPFQVSWALIAFLLIPHNLFLSKFESLSYFPCAVSVSVLFGAEAPPAAPFCNVQHCTVYRNSWLSSHYLTKQIVWEKRKLLLKIIKNNFYFQFQLSAKFNSSFN